MRLGINGTGLVQQASVQAVTDHARQAADDGFAHYWLAEHPTGGFDAITVLALVGAQVRGIELGTAIVPTFPRHPMAMAAHAVTAANALQAVHPDSPTDDGAAFSIGRSGTCASI